MVVPEGDRNAGPAVLGRTDLVEDVRVSGEQLGLCQQAIGRVRLRGCELGQKLVPTLVDLLDWTLFSCTLLVHGRAAREDALALGDAGVDLVEPAPVRVDRCDGWSWCEGHEA